MGRHDRFHRTATLTVVTLLALGACGGGNTGKTATPAASASGTIALTAPADGSTVGRSFTVEGVGSADEGTLLWTLSGPAGSQPTSGNATAGATSAQPFSFTVDAPGTGTYTLTVYRESATDGSKTDAVTRTITVR